MRFFIPSANCDGRPCLHWACVFHFATYFKPIEEIHDIIASINEENIETKRLIIPKKNDEFAIVSQQFNELLDKISFYIAQQKHFVEDVSHELRTPVAIVEGHLKLLNRWGKMTQKCWKSRSRPL